MFAGDIRQEVSEETARLSIIDALMTCGIDGVRGLLEENVR